MTSRCPFPFPSHLLLAVLTFSVALPASLHFQVKFYPGRYAAEKGSILPVGDLTQYIPDEEVRSLPSPPLPSPSQDTPSLAPSAPPPPTPPFPLWSERLGHFFSGDFPEVREFPLQADVAVLEEPEHLNWFHHGRCWTDKFNHVVGIVHTNYLDYARREEGGDIKEKLLKTINSWVCQAHCHKVIPPPLPLSNTHSLCLYLSIYPSLLPALLASLLPFVSSFRSVSLLSCGSSGGEAIRSSAAAAKGAHRVCPRRQPVVSRRTQRSPPTPPLEAPTPPLYPAPRGPVPRSSS